MTQREKFCQLIAGLQPPLEHFTADELLVKINNVHKGVRNEFPPEKLWHSIIPTVRVLDMLRAHLGATIIISSCYRSPAYNATIAGSAGNSQHSHFTAIDFHCTKGSPEIWAEHLKRMRNEGIFKGGIGTYHRQGFVHVDTRGVNATWLGK